MKTLSITQKNLNILLKIVTVAVLLLASGLFLAKSVQASPVLQQRSVPLIQLTQNNNQIVAEVVNAEEGVLEVDQDSWKWYRYHHVHDSRFGCLEEYHGLSDAELIDGAAEAEANQLADFGEVKHSVYEAQKNVYKHGTGSIVTLTEADEGLTYCFRVADTHQEVGKNSLKVEEVVINDVEDTAKTNEGGDIIDNNGDVVGGDTNNVDVGQVGAEGGIEGAATAEGDNDDEGNGNLVRNIGIFILVLAFGAGAFMLIRRSQSDDDDDEA